MKGQCVSPFRRRLENSVILTRAVARLAYWYLTFCNRTTRWDHAGLTELQADLSKGPVLLVIWHQCALMAPVHWPAADGQLSSIHASSPIARVSGAMQRLCGLLPMQLSKDQSNVRAARMLLGRVREGVSIGLAADGPLGPALEVKDAPLVWAEKTGLPVYTYAFATKRHRRLNVWDRMILPLPFSKGAVVFARLAHTAPARDDLRRDLEKLLNAGTKKADQMAGLSQ